VAFQLTEYFGIQPGNPASTIAVEDILDTEGLRRASVFAVIAGAYAMWASRLPAWVAPSDFSVIDR